MKIKVFLNILLVIVFIFLITPAVTLATWWNPLSWFGYWGTKDNTIQVQLLEQRIKDLETQLASSTAENNLNVMKLSNSKSQEQIEAEIDLKIQEALKSIEQTPKPVQSQNVVSDTISPVLPVNNVFTPSRPLKDNGEIDLSKYNELNVLAYVKNPKASLNRPVKIFEAIVVEFNQGVNNYIEVGDGYNTSSPFKTLELLIEDDDDYTKIANELVKGDRILVYGFGTENHIFNVIGNGGSYESSEPVIIVDAVYKCPGSGNCRYPYNGTDNLFLKKI